MFKRFINMGFYDRLIRLFLALVVFLGAFFWIGGWKSWVLLAVSAIMGLTALIGYCPAYKFAGKKKTQDDAVAEPVAAVPLSSVKKKILAWSIAVFVLLAAAGSFASIFLTEKKFLKDWNEMNRPYKQALYSTGQGNQADSAKYFSEFETQLGSVSDKYGSYRPFALRKDTLFSDDLARIRDIADDSGKRIFSGNLETAHLLLEEIRPIARDILERNGFSELAVALVDFHDSMEKVLDAAKAKAPADVITRYGEANDALARVEKEDQSPEVRSIREQLENVRKLSEEGRAEDLPAAEDALKKAFVKVYLEKG